MLSVLTAIATHLLASTLTLAPTAAAAPGDSWGMDLSENLVADADGTEPMTVFGAGIHSVNGTVGGAVELTTAPSLGRVDGSRYDNPGSQSFAMGVVFTSQPIPSSADYSGNLMQKGFFGDPGQVKLQLVPSAGGTVECRVKGTSGARMITSSVVVDDGAWHTAVCWRTAGAVGVTVDGRVTSRAWTPGAVRNTRLLTLGNKSLSAGSSDQHLGRTDFATWVVDPDARSVVEGQVRTSG